jgi:hypothetical protein
MRRDDFATAIRRTMGGAGGRRPSMLALVLLTMGWLTSGCDLGEADVVSRSPDLGPPIGNPPSSDASALGTGSDTADSMPEPSDASIVLKDTRVARPETGDTPAPRDAASPDASTMGSESGGQGEAGSRCMEPGFVFCADFEDGAAGWETTGRAWNVVEDTTRDDNLVFGPESPDGSKAIFAQAQWQDMTVKVRVRVLSFGQPTSANRAEVYARYQRGDLLYAVSLRGDGKLGLRKNSTGLGATATVEVFENEWHTLAIRVSGPEGAVAVQAFLDERMVATATDTDPSLGGPSSAVGAAGLGVYGETLAVFDDLKVSSP